MDLEKGMLILDSELNFEDDECCSINKFGLGFDTSTEAAYTIKTSVNRSYIDNNKDGRYLTPSTTGASVIEETEPLSVCSLSKLLVGSNDAIGVARSLFRSSTRKEERDYWLLQVFLLEDGESEPNYHPEVIELAENRPHRVWHVSHYARIQDLLMRNKGLRILNLILNWLEQSYRENANLHFNKHNRRFNALNCSKDRTWSQSIPISPINIKNNFSEEESPISPSGLDGDVTEERVILYELMLDLLRGGSVGEALSAAKIANDHVMAGLIEAMLLPSYTEKWTERTSLVPLFGEYVPLSYHNADLAKWTANEHRIGSLCQFYESSAHPKEHFPLDAAVCSVFAGHEGNLRQTFDERAWQNDLWIKLRCSFVAIFSKLLLSVERAKFDSEDFVFAINVRCHPGSNWIKNVEKELVAWVMEFIRHKLDDEFASTPPSSGEKLSMEEMQLRLIYTALDSLPDVSRRDCSRYNLFNELLGTRLNTSNNRIEHRPDFQKEEDGNIDIYYKKIEDENDEESKLVEYIITNHLAVMMVQDYAYVQGISSLFTQNMDLEYANEIQNKDFVVSSPRDNPFYARVIILYIGLLLKCPATKIEEGFEIALKMAKHIGDLSARTEAYARIVLLMRVNFMTTTKHGRPLTAEMIMTKELLCIRAVRETEEHLSGVKEGDTATFLIAERFVTLQPFLYKALKVNLLTSHPDVDSLFWRISLLTDDELYSIIDRTLSTLNNLWSAEKHIDAIVDAMTVVSCRDDQLSESFIELSFWSAFSHCAVLSREHADVILALEQFNQDENEDTKRFLMIERENQLREQLQAAANTALQSSRRSEVIRNNCPGAALWCVETYADSCTLAMSITTPSSIFCVKKPSDVYCSVIEMLDMLCCGEDIELFLKKTETEETASLLNAFRMNREAFNHCQMEINLKILRCQYIKS